MKVNEYLIDRNIAIMGGVVAKKHRLKKLGEKFYDFTIVESEIDVAKTLPLDYIIKHNMYGAQSGEQFLIDVAQTNELYGEQRFNKVLEIIESLVDLSHEALNIASGRSYVKKYDSGAVDGKEPIVYWAEKTLEELNTQKEVNEKSIAVDIEKPKRGRKPKEKEELINKETNQTD